jgi:hypothetical protein
MQLLGAGRGAAGAVDMDDHRLHARLGEAVEGFGALGVVADDAVDGHARNGAGTTLARR